MFDLYCWIHSTYTIPRALSLHVGRDVAHPGVMTSAHDQEDERRYVTYYQWVGFTLFFQAILFYIPRSVMEGSVAVDQDDDQVPLEDVGRREDEDVGSRKV